MDRACPERPAPASATRLRLRLMATTDLHAHLVPWDYQANAPSYSNGFAMTASLIRQARAEVAASILLDNGDFLNGSPLSEVPRPGEVGNPVVRAMNALGYDAATLGNHELSHGVGALGTALAECNFPVVSSNVLRGLGAGPGQDRFLVPPSLILTRQMADMAGQRQELRIGLVGFAPPQVVTWDRAAIGADLAVRDILEAARHHVAALRAEGVDLVIALSHSGIEGSDPAPMMENATAALARIPGIDVLVAGHTHQAFPSASFPATPGVDARTGRIHGKPAIMPGFHGSHLGLIDLVLERSDRWRIAEASPQLRPIAQRAEDGRLKPLTDPDPEILALAAPAHRATLDWAMETVGHTAAPIHSFFAMVAPAAPVRLVARAQADYVRRQLQGTALGDLPVLSVTAPFHSGGRGGPENFTHVAVGRVTRRHIFDLYPHPNTIAALRLTGAELALWLERSFSQFHRIEAGAVDAPLLDPDFPSFNFDTIEGLSWEVDLSAPARTDARGAVCDPLARRIHDLRFQGRPLDPGQSFILATNSYRATGSGGFPVGGPERLVLKGPKASREILAEHIADQAEVAPAGPPSWRFRSLPGTSVVFDSAPSADHHLAELSPLKVEALGLTPEGFRRFRLHL